MIRKTLAVVCAIVLGVPAAFATIAPETNFADRYRPNPVVAGPDAACDVRSRCDYPGTGCSPIGLVVDQGTNTMWVASESCGDDLDLKSFSLSSPVSCAPLSECAIPNAGDGDGVAILPNGNLLVTDFNGDLATFDDNIMEVDRNCNLVNFWATDDTTCGTCPPNSCNIVIDQILGIEVESDDGNTITVEVVENLNGVVWKLALDRSGAPGPGSCTFVSSHLAPTPQVGIDLVSNAGDSSNLLSSFIDFRLSLADDDWNVIDSCVLPSGFPGDISECNSSVMHAEINGELLELEGFSGGDVCGSCDLQIQFPNGPQVRAGEALDFGLRIRHNSLRPGGGNPKVYLRNRDGLVIDELVFEEVLLGYNDSWQSQGRFEIPSLSPPGEYAVVFHIRGMQGPGWIDRTIEVLPQ